MIVPYSVDEARIWHNEMLCNKKLSNNDNFLLLFFDYKVGDSTLKPFLPLAFA